MRDTNDLPTTITLGPVNRVGQTPSLELGVQMALPRPDQDEHLPDQIEAVVPQGGLEIPRRLFQALIEKADQELVLQRRQGNGGAGIRLRGTRPFTLQDALWRGHRSAVANRAQEGGHDGGAVGARLEHVPPTPHHPESPGRGL